MATINIRSLYKQFDDTEAVSGIDLDISDGEFVVLVGPSGCGKTTTLRMIAGLEEVTGGTITVDGQTINDMAPKDRDVAMVFQNYALYPHMTVFENMAFGLRFRKIPGPQIKKRVAEVAGDQVWELPVFDEYKQQIDSEIADVKNAAGREASAITAAMFLKVFAGDTPWAHLDIAGTAWIDEARPYQAKGPSGVAVRTLVELACASETWATG